MKILIDSVYLNSFGGQEILDLIINNLNEDDKKNDFFHLLDIRNKLNMDDIDHKFCYPKIRDRKRFYAENINKFDKIICLANVPPPIHISNKSVIILFHNALILEWTGSLSIFSNIKNLIKRQFINLSILKSYSWVVQTELMKTKLSNSLYIAKDNIDVFPFFREQRENSVKKSSENFIQILCVTSESPHKKNKNLIKAFAKAKFDSNYKVTLSLTLNKKNIKTLQKNKEIIFLGNLSRDQVNLEYSKSDYLIYPSVIESFGLPLVESTYYNLKILASNSEYVNYVVKPSLSFDSNSITSIKEAIEKVVNLNNIKESKLLVKNELDSFINFICSNV